MELKEAIYKMLPGDIFETDENCYSVFKMQQNGTLKTTSETIVSFSAEHMTIKGQIIPAKKEMVNFDEWNTEEQRSGDGAMMTAYEHRELAWQASEQNRDLLYVDLMGLIDKFRSNTGLFSESGITEEVDKIKDVLDPPF